MSITHSHGVKGVSGKTLGLYNGSVNAGMYTTGSTTPPKFMRIITEAYNVSPTASAPSNSGTLQGTSYWGVATNSSYSGLTTDSYSGSQTASTSWSGTLTTKQLGKWIIKY